MSIPNLRAEIAFDSGFSTAEGARTWTDVTADTDAGEGVSIGYGRADAQSVADPNTLSLTLKNKTGKYTPGNTASPFYPNVKKGKPVRVSVRYPDASVQPGNLLSANQASMETDVSAWSAGGSVPPVLSSSTTHVSDGTKALLVTWGTGGTLPIATTTATGLVVGRTYTAQAQVWVPTGSPNVRLVVGSTFGTSVSTKNAFATASVTFVATTPTHQLQVWPATAPTSGQLCWVDAVMLDEGSTVGAFTTNPPPISIRYTGYINEWPVVWPDGSDQSSFVTIGAQSRRARLGQSAPLTSAIRAAYLASSPDAYWPMDDDIHDTAGQSVFLDVTNTIVNAKPTQMIAGFFDDITYAPVLNGAPGPTDEGNLVKFPKTNSSVSTFATRYVGGSGVTNLDKGAPTGGFTAEMVARIDPAPRPGTEPVNVVLFRVGSAAMRQEMYCFVYDDTNPATGTGSQNVGVTMVIRDSNMTIVEQPAWTPIGATTYPRVTDGELHHFAIICDNGFFCQLYVDGVAVAFTFLSTHTFTERFNTVVIGNFTRYGDMYAGHMATYDRELDPTLELLPHANAATAVTETTTARVVRVAGRIGVPSSEIDVETSVSASLGSQPEAGQAATQIIDDIATSTGGVVYDTRAGHLALQARNHRYNVAPAFTLSAGGQEIEADLTVVLDDRYLVNTVEFSRTDTTDQAASTITDDASIAAYGIYSRTLSVASTTDTQVEAAARDILYRYSEPGVRVSQVSVDIGDLSSSQRALVLAADIGTRFNIATLPAQAPSDPMSLFVEGYTETIGAAGHFMTINTTRGDLYQNVLVTDDATRGTTNSVNVAAY